MRFTYIQHMPYRHLPERFRGEPYEPIVTTPYHELADPKLVHEDLRSALDECMHAARSGFDAVALTEHGQSSYDMNPNPDLGAAALAYSMVSEGLNCGLYIVGRSLGKSREPLRVAEELAWLDNLSQGRLIAGFPVGLAYDANINAGVPPIETRARYDENLALVLRAWTEREPFAWNGNYAQYMGVNIWPRPYQDPHPPISITGTGNPHTARFALQRDFGFNMVVLGAGASAAERIFRDLWRTADELGVDDNPFRANYAKHVLVADSDAQAEELYGEHVRYSMTRGLGAIATNRYALPGGISPEGLRVLLRQPPMAGSEIPSFGQLVDSGVIVAGSPATVRERLNDAVRTHRVGNLLLFFQMGSMSQELVRHNVDQFSAHVMPGLRDIWSEYEDTNRWWPAALGGRPVSAAQAATNGTRLT